jgi:hypothetical protein
LTTIISDHSTYGVDIENDIPAYAEQYTVDRKIARIALLCQCYQITHYANLPGGKDLYDQESFNRCGIELSFIDPFEKEYTHFGYPFCASMSILDALMHLGIDEVSLLVNQSALNTAV